MINRCKDAMRKWCKSKGIDFSSLLPIMLMPPPAEMGPPPFANVRGLPIPDDFDVWDYALS